MPQYPAAARQASMYAPQNHNGLTYFIAADRSKYRRATQPRTPYGGGKGPGHAFEPHSALNANRF